mmetsp:Transcript_29708/g.75636  ORF Transcript_29708/g.75636 Transcript_29708/m.75636 type:complete len:251 (+) Transcript_29708:384-1136(+)
MPRMRPVAASSVQPISLQSHNSMAAPLLFLPIWQLTLTTAPSSRSLRNFARSSSNCAGHSGLRSLSGSNWSTIGIWSVGSNADSSPPSSAASLPTHSWARLSRCVMPHSFCSLSACFAVSKSLHQRPSEPGLPPPSSTRRGRKPERSTPPAPLTATPSAAGLGRGTAAPVSQRVFGGGMPSTASAALSTPPVYFQPSAASARTSGHSESTMRWRRLARAAGASSLAFCLSSGLSPSSHAAATSFAGALAR